jgi:hypothetical protein
MSDWQQNIERMADFAKVEIIKDGLRARCHIAAMVSHHIRSLAQLRLDRVAEKLSKQQVEIK